MESLTNNSDYHYSLHDVNQWWKNIKSVKDDNQQIYGSGGGNTKPLEKFFSEVDKHISEKHIKYLLQTL